MKLTIWLIPILWLGLGVRNIQAEEFYQDNRGITTVYRDKVPHIGKNGELKYSYDGNSFFPLVMYFTDLGDKGQIKQWLGLDATKSRDTLGEVKSAGFNASWPAWPFPTEGELNYFDSMGMKIVPNVSDMAWRAANNKDGWTMQKLKDVIAATKNHPSILAWHLFDEEPARTANDMDNDKWRAVHDAIKSVDPTRLVFANNYKANCNYDYFSDISNIDMYVVKSANSGLGRLVEGTDKAVACNLNEPAWVIVQTFTDDSAFNWVMPTAGQIRAQLYAAIAHGATGLWAFIQHTPWAWRGENATRWDQPDPEGKFLGINPQVTPDLWAEVTRSNKEIDRYKYIWLAKTSSEGYNMAFTKRFDADDKYDVPIRTILKDTGDPNKRYLLAVNISAVPVRAKVTMVGVVTGVNSLFDGQVMATTGNSWVEDIPAYGVKLYEVWKTGQCRVQGFKLGGNGAPCDGTNCPKGIEVVVSGGEARSTNDPYVITGVVAGNKTVEIAEPSGYKAEYSSCEGCTDHPESSWKVGRTVGINCGAGSYVDLWWRLKKNLVLGDANGDGRVNVADFAIWKTEYLTKSGTKSDFNKDGRVTIGDFAIWKTEYLRGR